MRFLPHSKNVWVHRPARRCTSFLHTDGNPSYMLVKIYHAYWVEIASTWHHGLCRISQIPFGLRNAHCTAKRTMDVMLSRKKLRLALVYLGDIIFVLYCNADEYIWNVCTVLRFLHKSAVILNLEKGRLFPKKIDFLGILYVQANWNWLITSLKRSAT